MTTPLDIFHLRASVANWRTKIEAGAFNTVLSEQERRHYCHELVWAEVGLKGSTPSFAYYGAQKLVNELREKVMGEGQ